MSNTAMVSLNAEVSVSSIALCGVCLALTLLTGCAGSSATTDRGGTMSERSWTDAEAETRLQNAVERWNGVPHKLGGTSQEGVDCSGLVQSVFSNEFQHPLPRTTEKQADVGTTVHQSELRPGDLVFFRPEWKKRHVGIYVSDGRFLHASSSEGVRLSELDRSYWQDHWWQARRVLSRSTDSTGQTSDRPPPETASEDISW